MADISYPTIPQVDPPRSAKDVLPTMYDLPSEDPEEPGLPDEFHDLQPQLLSRTLQLTDYSRANYFSASDLNLYYDVKHPVWHKRPDWFLVLDVPRLYEGVDLRRSYVIWQEGAPPYVIVEFLSPGTEREDLGRFYNLTSNVPESGAVPDRDLGHQEESALTGADPQTNGTTVSQPQKRTKPPGKFTVYEHYLRVPHYIVYSRYTQQLRYFKLEGGRYQEQPLQRSSPHIWLSDLEIGLSIWEGEFEDVPGHWLRWCDQAGNWLLTDTEQERLEKEQAQAQLRQAAQSLFASGMTMPQICEILGLSEAQVRASLPKVDF